MRTIVIGDVHGCLDELRNLVSALNLRHDDRLVFAGDLVDKGPNSIGVVRHVKLLMRLYPGSVCVSGNHEEKASRQWKRGIAVEPWCEQATDEDWAFIDAMPLTWHDAALNVRVVHGGIFPALLRKHPDAFEKIEARGDKWRKGGGKALARARRMLRVRHVSKDEGDMVALGENKSGDPFWADAYDGSAGFVIYGHSPQLSGNVRRTEHTLGIDTACVFGKRLTAAVIDGSWPIQTVSVGALKRHALAMFGDDD